MKSKLIALFIGLSCLLCFSAFIVDDDPFTQLLKKLEEFAKKYPQEKIHLHLDKPYYAIGDDIWFKAYVVNAKTNVPSNISNILYVELINEKDSISKQLKLQMKGGIVWGDFKLSDSLSDGNYRIRAYTQWMRNVGPTFFFDKTIKIGNRWTNKVFTKASSSVVTEGVNERINTAINFSDKNGNPYANSEVNFEIKFNNKTISKGKVITSSIGDAKISMLNTLPNLYRTGVINLTITLLDGTKILKTIPIKTTITNDVQFFPEGGTLVDNLPSKIAVKIINQNGKGENASGKIYDNEGNEILDFETTYLGMGSFSLTPNTGKKYIAKLKFADGTTKSINLPASVPSGHTIAVNNIDTAQIKVRVMLSPDLLNSGTLNLLAHRNGIILFSAKVPTVKQITSLAIQKKTLPSGIISITLFSPENLPIAERIAFVDNSSDKINLNIDGLKENYAKAENVVLNILASNMNKPVQGSFSTTITNSTIVDPDIENETNILTSLLLTSDLKGYVEKPNHYFLNQELKTRIELDNLLLTQGWRTIDWKLLTNSQWPNIIYSAEKGLKISGLLTYTGKPIANGKVSLLSSSGGIFAADTLTDSNGRFNFDQISFNDGTRFAIKAISNKDKKNIKIIMDDLPGQVITTNPNSAEIEININETLNSYLKKSNSYFEEQEKRGFLTRVNSLKQVEIFGEKKKKAPNSSNFNGAGNADAVFDADELKNSISLTHFLNGRVPGFSVDNGIPRLTRNGDTMTVYIDGVKYLDGNGGPIRGIQTLEDLTIGDIESIEVLKSIGYTSVYGHDGANGVILITTKTGQGVTSSSYSPGMLTYTPKGLSFNRQFYSPKYEAAADIKSDLRTTVYWNPHFITDVDGKANINFYNTDQIGNYRMVIEGIDADGNLARKTITYQVK